MWEGVDSLLLSPGAAIARVNTRGRQVTVVLLQARRAHITGQEGIAQAGQTVETYPIMEKQRVLDLD